jgi:hypothetical protein
MPGRDLEANQKWPFVSSLFIPERHQEKYTALPNPKFPAEAKKQSHK